PFQGWRLTFFQAVIFAMFALFSIRMYELQIIDFEAYEARADENRLSSLPLPASRGAIRDRYDVRLAFNVPAYNVTIIPAELPENREQELAIFNRLSALVDIPPTREIAISAGRRVRSIEELVAEGEGIAPFRPVIIALDVPLRVAMQILEERIYMPGVDIDPVGVREYPTGASSAHIVGYMGPIPEEEAEALREQGYNPAFDRIGYEGIERYLETTLGGTRGSRLREVDVAGQVQGVISETPAIPGQSVRLTIDVELQQIAEASLLEWIQFRNANPNPADKGLSTQGVAIAMNPMTGEILALVSIPTYDNSRFARAIDGQYYLDIAADPARPLVNNAIKGLYPPGSVWKLITAAGVVEENIINPDTSLRDEGDLIIENRYAPNDPAAAQRFVCWLRTGHGSVDFIQGIAWSCDVYFYQIGGGNTLLSPQILTPGGLGIDGLFRYATATGIGSELGVELPFENSGRMPDPDWKRRNYGENWSTGDTFNAAFGQGYVTVTPLQLLMQTAAIINNGTLHQPTLIRDFLDEEGNVVTPFTPLTLRTLNPEQVPPGEPLVLLLLEDMLMKGQTSLACICEPNSPFYDPFRCDPAGYRNTVNVSADPFVPQEREYRVHIPLNYTFNGNICQPIRFPNAARPYRPAFLRDRALELTRQGMLAAATIEGGTARRAALTDTPFSYIQVAGKTGTAEYCDDVARPLGYCVPGQWPSHAWYAGYAPYENPEIAVIAFVYNGGEGSRIALPVVREIMTAYFELKQRRGEPLPPRPTGN
nr:penicillin-binding protein 2 [Anaerolineae bacterium]